MNDLDEALTRLARAPVPELDGLEARVLAQIATPRATQAGLGIGAIMVAALAIGMIGAGFPASPSAAASISPLGANSPFAPSTLLVGAQ
ncbi:hypothetical protein H5J25_03875 [Sphingomonas aliaeris]|uniref:Uncharacterized protein n=1 Tax=Sphingomonas aliaeris TaxID=2759526 RepID=A0A974S5L7_9SPHN|nr:hypothetical protein [Sphingomonas aliaeris]QQV78822.1 hypothetical protein H5J25_03875 [Sphingomonas aliaeris]